jgi:acyl-[acyl-carrier-protein]-phospholipid O-acyltransferase/long-chain-fatty-acid--[acyl-carrier-protein] ligase
MQQFQLGETRTGLMAAGTGLGIALGCVIGMALSHRRFNANLVRFGSWGMLLGLILLALPGSRQGSLLGPVGTSALLVWLGVCAGMYTVPLQVMLQARAPEEHKGRVIGAMNLANWIGIYSSAACYKTVFTPLLVAWQLPQNLLFGGAALFLLPVVLFYHPRSENLDDATHLAEAQSH